MSNLSLGFIGAGAVGNVLALALSAKGYKVVAAASRSFASTRRLAERVPGCRAFALPQQVADQCDLVFITTPDGAIEDVASGIAWRPGQSVVHTSGALGLEVLSVPRDAGVLVGSLHPLQSFVPVEEVAKALALFKGITCAVQAEGLLKETLEEMARVLGARPLHIRAQDRSLYHVSAVMACGYLLALLKSSCRLWNEMGFTEEDALDALLPLSRSTLENAARDGLERAVTGPIVRGDAATVRLHLESLEARAPETAPLYCLLGLESLAFVRERGVSWEAMAEVETLLRSALRDAWARL